jgi:hypothetical protein
MSRLWTNPPLKPDGTLDYARLTVAEICEDLAESLMDRIDNSGLDGLQPFLYELPDDELPDADPSDALVRHMEELLHLASADPQYSSAAAHDAIRGAILELKLAASRPGDRDSKASEAG